MIRELSSYIYGDKTSDGGLRMPKDSDNHLCDALRYAFEDVKHFHPCPENEEAPETNPQILKSDFNGGWDI